MTKQLDNLISKYIQKNTGDTNTIIINDIDYGMNLKGVILEVTYNIKIRDTTIIKDGHTFDNSVYTMKNISIKIDDLNGDF